MNNSILPLILSQLLCVLGWRPTPVAPVLTCRSERCYTTTWCCELHNPIIYSPWTVNCISGLYHTLFINTLVIWHTVHTLNSGISESDQWKIFFFPWSKQPTACLGLMILQSGLMETKCPNVMKRQGQEELIHQATNQVLQTNHCVLLNTVLWFGNTPTALIC